MKSLQNKWFFGGSKKKEYYHVFTTSSKSSTWETGAWYGNNYNNYEILVIDSYDNSVRYTLTTSQNNWIMPSIDLSSFIGDAQIWIDNNETDINEVYLWVANINITYYNTGVFPRLKKIAMYSYTAITHFSGSINNLEHFETYTCDIRNLDFSTTTKMKYFRIYGNAKFNVPINLNNNYLLETFSLDSTGYPQYVFTPQNHANLKHLTIRSNTLTSLSSSINNSNLPNLLELRLITTNYISADFNVSNVTTINLLYLKCNSISGLSSLVNLKNLDFEYTGANTNISFSSLVNLETMLIRALANYIIDLKPLIKLKSFSLLYTIYPNLTTVDIKNGLNNQITLFQKLYDSKSVNVIVDNPINAEAGISPYVTSVWKKWYTTYEVLKFI